MFPSDLSFFFIFGGVFRGVVVPNPSRDGLDLILGLGEVKLIPGEGESIEEAEGDFAEDLGVA